jgi:phage repressor protein C with HTH and peptisase S24 domain
MDSARNLIVTRVAELGLSLSDLSLQVGKNHAYFQQFIKRGVPARLPEEVRGRVAEILKIDERQLKIAKSDVSLPVAPPNATVGAGVKFASWIPVYGHAVGGKDGEFILNGNQVTEVLAPASLSSVPGAYAVYVVGDSMDDNVPHAYIKRFVSQDAKRLRLEQYNPKKMLEFPAAKVVSVHRIIMGGDK